MGQEFSFPLLEEVTRLEEDQLREVVDKAVSARVLVPGPSLRQEAYAFADEVIRDVLYEGIGPARRRRCHLKVGQALERVHPRRLEEQYDALSCHFLEGNDLEKAVEYALKAGDRASGVYSWERAMTHYKTALELMDELEAGPRQRAEVLEKLVARKGGVEVSQASHPSIIAPGLVSFFLGDWDKAEAELLQCLETDRRAHHVGVRQFTTEGLGRLYLERGDLVSAKAHLEEALTISQPRGDKAFELISRAPLAEIACRRGGLEEAAAHLRRAQEILAEGEDWHGVAGEVHLAEGILAAAEQRWQEAEAAFQKAAEINRQYHLPYYEARSLFAWRQMSLSRHSPGDWEKSMRLLDQALAVFQGIQAKKMVEKVAAALVL